MRELRLGDCPLSERPAQHCHADTQSGAPAPHHWGVHWRLVWRMTSYFTEGTPSVATGDGRLPVTPKVTLWTSCPDTNLDQQSAHQWGSYGLRYFALEKKKKENPKSCFFQYRCHNTLSFGQHIYREGKIILFEEMPGILFVEGCFHRYSPSPLGCHQGRAVFLSSRFHVGFRLVFDYLTSFRRF